MHDDTVTDTAVSDAAAELARLRQQAGRLLLALDFDGTLAPIVPRPEDAAMLDSARPVLERLGRRDDTVIAVVSGRGLEDVRGRVGADSIFYAGNHGYEIEGPGLSHRLPEAERMRPELAAIAAVLRQALAPLDGAQVEDKGVTLSVHYRRLTEPAAEQRVLDAVADATRGVDGLRLTHGKKVVEVRPALDWHKGRAIEFLLDALFPGRAPAVAFVGDDVTDEDGFRAVRRRGGMAILVSDDPERKTDATVRIDSPQALVRLLEHLTDGGRAG